MDIEAPKIKDLKWKNLQLLLEFVPPVYHSFYTNLPHEYASKGKTKQKKSKNNVKKQVCHQLLWERKMITKMWMILKRFLKTAVDFL